MNIQCLDTYFCKILGKVLKNAATEHQKLRKKIRNLSLKTRDFKKKNKKKSGSNDENLRKLEPQQKQRVLIKKMSVNPAVSSLFIFKCKRVLLNKKIFLSTSFVGKSLRDLWEVENVLYTVKNLKTKDSEKMYFTL